MMSRNLLKTLKNHELYYREFVLGQENMGNYIFADYFLFVDTTLKV